LWSEIEAALSQSEFLLLMASPTSASSPWVLKELTYWIENRDPAKLILLVTDGELEWDDAEADFDWSRTTALPTALRGKIRQEPLYADLRFAKGVGQLSTRHPEFLDRVAMIAAALHGRPRDEISGDDVREHRRTRNVVWTVGLLLSVLTVAAVWFAIDAYRRGKLIANQNTTIKRNSAVIEQNNIKISDQNVRLLESNATITKQNETLRLQLARGLASQASLAIERRQPHKAAVYVSAAHELADSPAVRASALTLESSILRYRGRLACGGKAANFRFSRDGKLFVAPSGSADLQVWELDGGSATLRTIRHGPFSDVSPDGRMLASIDGRIIRLADARTGEQRSSFGFQQGLPIALSALAFDPTGKRIAAGPCPDGQLRLWDTGSGTVVATLTAGEYVLFSLSFSGDGSWLACAKSGAPDVLVWQLPAGAKPEPAPRLLKGHTTAVNAVVFSPDSLILASGDLRGHVMLWDLVTRTPRLTLVGHTDPVACLAFSPDGRHIVSGDNAGTVRLWNVATGALVHTADDMEAEVEGVGFSPDGKLLAASSRNGWIRFWDYTGNDRGHLELLTRAWDSSALALSADGRIGLPAGRPPLFAENVLGPILSARRRLQPSGVPPIPALSLLDRAQLYDAVTGERVRVLDTADNPVVALRFHPSKDLLAKGTKGGRVELWSHDASRFEHAFNNHDLPIGCILFNHSGNLMAACDQEEFRVCIWEIEARRALPPYASLPAPMRAPVIGCPLGFSADSRYLLTNLPGGPGSNAKLLWEVKSGRRVQVPGVASFTEVGFRPNSSSFFGVTSGKLRAWDTNDWSELRCYSELAIMARDFVFSPDGGRLATLEDGFVAIRDAQTGRLERRLAIRDWHLFELAFTPDARLVMALGYGGDVNVWDSLSGELIGRSRPFGQMESMCIDPSGRRVIAMGDEPLGVWVIGDPLPPGKDAASRASGYTIEGMTLIPMSAETEKGFGLTAPLRACDFALVDYWEILARVRRASVAAVQAKKSDGPDPVDLLRAWVQKHPQHPRVEHAASDLVELRNTGSRAGNESER
jgi:WD40 repeat protein